MLKTSKKRSLLAPALLAAALLMAASPGTAHGFGKKPVTPPSEPSDPVEPPSTDVIRGRWEAKQRDGAEWSQYVYDQIPILGPNLIAKNPADIANFCPNYANLSKADKRNVWVYLISGMSERESAHNPNTTYKESFNDAKGNPVISAGLLQISVESANSYGCGFKNTEELKDPKRNLACGLRILNKWLGNDGVVSGKVGSSWKGGARYWSVLRTGTSLTTIQNWTKAQRLCQK